MSATLETMSRTRGYAGRREQRGSMLAIVTTAKNAEDADDDEDDQALDPGHERGSGDVERRHATTTGDREHLLPPGSPSVKAALA